MCRQLLSNFNLYPYIGKGMGDQCGQHMVDARGKGGTSMLKLAALALSGFVFVASEACAEWRLEAQSYEAKFYIEDGTLSREGNSIRAWQMADFTKPKASGGQNVLSSKTLNEHDCRQGRERWLMSYDYEGNMGAGQAVRTYRGPGPWDYPAPGSVAFVLMSAVCKR